MTSKVKSVTPFLMFQDNVANDAIASYTSIFPNFELESIARYGPGENGKEGSVKMARVRIGGLEVRINDSPIKHAFDFTPSISLFVELSDEETIATVTEQLEKGGKTLMPLGSYGFSSKFAWVSDKWGVSWQLNLA
jgi:predicted 3-demethylubiquinone-9 3-methyltransferase (glyoxalase superfamily)